MCLVLMSRMTRHQNGPVILKEYFLMGRAICALTGRAARHENTKKYFSSQHSPKKILSGSFCYQELDILIPIRFDTLSNWVLLKRHPNGHQNKRVPKCLAFKSNLAILKPSVVVLVCFHFCIPYWLFGCSALSSSL